MENLNTIQAEAEARIAGTNDLAALDEVRIAYLGKKGELTSLLKQLGKLAPEERREAGAQINAAKQAVQQLLEARKTELGDAKLAAQLASETIDVTLPGRGKPSGGFTRSPVR